MVRRIKTCQDSLWDTHNLINYLNFNKLSGISSLWSTRVSGLLPLRQAAKINAGVTKIISVGKPFKISMLTMDEKRLARWMLLYWWEISRSLGQPPFTVN